jgi:hypothetical protein
MLHKPSPVVKFKEFETEEHLYKMSERQEVWEDEWMMRAELDHMFKKLVTTEKGQSGNADIWDLYGKKDKQDIGCEWVVTPRKAATIVPI